MRRRIFTILKVLFFLSIGFFFIWIFLRQLNSQERQEIIFSLKQADYSWVVISIFAGAVAHYIRAERWRLLMKPVGYSPGHFNTFLAVMIGYLSNLALPRLGEVTRCGILHKYEKIPVNKSFGTVIAERSVDMIFFLMLFFVNLWVFWSQLANYVNTRVFDPVSQKLIEISNSSTQLWIAGISIAAIITTGVIVQSFFRHAKIYIKVKSVVKGFIEGLKSVFLLEKTGLFILYTFLIWIMYFLMVYLCFFSMPETAGLSFGAGLSVLIFGSIGIMIVQGGIGVYPAIVAETLFLYGITEVKGYALGWITWSAQNVMIVAFGIFSLILLPVINRKFMHINPSKS
ncbi:MAG: lysylphosphatidylglycerol synthase transmembrane domain-containing protein [Bacteroidales bacterium]